MQLDVTESDYAGNLPFALNQSITFSQRQVQGKNLLAVDGAVVLSKVRSDCASL